MKAVFSFLLFIISVQSFAQEYPITSITISLPANPDANVANWGSGASMLNITATTRLTSGRVDGRVQESKILVLIKKSGAKTCGTYTNNSAPSSNFNSATKVWSGRNALSLLGEECTLTPGDYELCVQFWGEDARGKVAMSDEKCKQFTIKSAEQKSYQPPHPVFPANGSSISEANAKLPIVFRWTPVIPKPAEPVSYRINVWQLMQGQTSVQAIKSQPIITQNINNLTQATLRNIISGPCKLPYLCEFVWNVQALNREGKPIGSNNGTSEAFTFNVADNTENNRRLVLIAPANGTTVNELPNFRWGGADVTGDGYYKINIVEIKGDESPENALRTNKPFFEKDSLRELSFIYPTTSPIFIEGKKYAWLIEAKRNGVKITESEINEFVVETKSESQQRIVLTSPKNGDVIQPGQKPKFTWLPPIASLPNATYKIKIVEIKGDESPEQALRGNKPHFEKDSLIWRSFEYPSSAPGFINGKKYAWEVETSGQQRKSQGESNSKSDPNTFSAGSGNKKSVSVNPSDTAVEVAPVIITDTGSAVTGDTIRAGLDGEFLIAVSQVTKESDGSLTGKGTVTVNWLSTNIAVEFKKIRVDSTRRLTAGGIITEKSSGVNYLQAWALANVTSAVTLPVDGVMNWTNNTVDNVISWANNNNGSLPAINYQSNIAAPPIPANSLKMPFGIKFDDPDDKLMITEMIFKPNVSKVNFLVQKKFTKGVTDYKLGFAGKYFEIHPKRIEFSNGRVELVENIDVPNLVSNPKIRYTFKKGSGQNGCFVEWDSTGLKEVSLGMEMKFTRDWLLPVPTTNDSVKAIITGKGTSLQDILLTGSLSHCEIVGTNGIKLLADSVSLDLSSARNTPSMYFPANYNSDTSAQGKLLWEGLYIKTLKLTLPDTWKTGANPTIITATNSLVDDHGVTMKVKAINVITFPAGRVADMSASLDTLTVAMLKGSLTDGSAKGKLVLPISNDTITNTLKYGATFAQAGGINNFQIVIKPLGPIDADILKASITLFNTSNITATLSDTAKSFALNLNGTLDWGNKDLSVTDTTAATGGAPVRKKGIKGIKMEMDFQNLKIGYLSNSNTNTSGMDFHPGSWSFASPQKRLANFPVSIKKVYYKSLQTVTPSNTNLKELFRGALMIDIVANLTDDIGGSTTLGGAFAIELNKSAKKFLPKFKGVFVEDIEVHADMPAVKIDGKLKMYDNHAMYGDGFLATLGVSFKAVSVQANALVQFGNTVYNNNNQYYRYWRAEADVRFSPGVPFLTGVGFYGFGGGAFYNMDAITVAKTAPEVGFKYTFVPKKSSLGFKVMATIGTMPKVETFNADVSLLAQFNSTTGGLTKIDFNGDFWLAAKLDERPSAKILGGLNINYTFPTKIFNLAGALAINAAPAIATLPGNPLGVSLRIDGFNNKWYFKCGTPTNTNDVKVMNMLNLYSYFMFGNDLGTDIPNGFTTGFVNNYNTTFPGNPIVNTSDGGASLTATGTGIATGVGIKFDKSLSTSLPTGLVRTWSFDFIMKAGAELNAALLQYSGACGGYNPVGIRGFRANGSVGFYARMTGSLKGTVKNKPSPFKDKTYPICDIRGGGWLQGSFPNPEYFQGAIDGKVGLFDDLVDMNFHKDFTYGQDCGSMPQAAGPAIVETDTVANLKNKLVQYVNPTTKYNFPVTSPVLVKYNLLPNQVFDVAEMQSSGSIKNRTFKLVVTTSFQVQNAAGAWVALTYVGKANNSGEFQYYVKPPFPNTTTGVLLGSPINKTFNTNSGNTLMASNGLFLSASIVSPVPPPPPPNYPNPVPPAVNSLVADRDYRFTVTATLKELIGGTWNTAVTKTGSPVTETKTKTFRTGPMQILQAGSATQKNGSVKQIQ